jgi:hypothetical protein
MPVGQTGRCKSSLPASVLAWNNSALFLRISLGALVGGEAISHGNRGRLDDLGVNRDLRLGEKLRGYVKPRSTSLDGMTVLSIGGKGDKNDSIVRSRVSRKIGFVI